MWTWRFAVREDRRRLPAFRCAPDPRRRRLTRRFQKEPACPWESEIQGFVRQLGVPLAPPHFCLVALDGDDIVAVVRYSMEEAPRLIDLELMAVAMTHRHNGGWLADDALAEFMSRALSEITEPATVTIAGHIHSRNAASRDFAERNGFVNTGRVDGVPIYDGRYEVWELVLDL